jgi:hypothetical protein
VPRLKPPCSNVLSSPSQPKTGKVLKLGLSAPPRPYIPALAKLARRREFKADIPLKQRNGWENYLREEGEKVRRLTAEIEHAEREIDSIVYKLFDLTPDEITLLENSLTGQY